MPPSTTKGSLSPSPQKLLEDATFSFTTATSSGGVQPSRKQLAHYAIRGGEKVLVSEWTLFQPVRGEQWKHRVLVRWNTFAYPVIADNDLVKGAWPAHFRPDNAFLPNLFSTPVSRFSPVDCFLVVKARPMSVPSFDFFVHSATDAGSTYVRVEVAVQLWLPGVVFFNSYTYIIGIRVWKVLQSCSTLKNYRIYPRDERNTHKTIYQNSKLSTSEDLGFFAT